MRAHRPPQIRSWAIAPHPLLAVRPREPGTARAVLEVRLRSSCTRIQIVRKRLYDVIGRNSNVSCTAFDQGQKEVRTPRTAPTSWRFTSAEAGTAQNCGTVH